MSDRERILNKIKGLQALSESDNEQEAAAAAAMAYRMLLKYDLEQADIDEFAAAAEGRSRVQKGSHFAADRLDDEWWIGSLGADLASCFGGTCVRTKHRGDDRGKATYTFVVLEQDVEICQFLFDQLRTKLDLLRGLAVDGYVHWRKEQGHPNPWQLKGKFHPKVFENSWLWGCLLALQARLDEELAAAGDAGTALVLRKEAITQEYLNEMFPRLTSVRSADRQYNEQGLKQGQEAGKKITWHKGVEAEAPAQLPG